MTAQAARTALAGSVELTEGYLAAFAASGVTATTILDGVRPSTVDTGFLGRPLSRPVFLDYRTISQLEADLEQLHAALTSLPGRLFGGDMAAFARAVGATPGQASIVLRGSRGSPSRMGRADFYLDQQGFRLLEVNCGAALGGLDSAILNRAMAEQPLIAEFLRQHQLGYVDPMVELVRTLFSECAIPAGVRPAVALADWPASFATLEPRLRRNVPDYARFGIDAYPCHLGQLRYEQGRVWLGEQPMDAVYRLFLMEDLLDPTGPGLIEPVLRAAERGEVAIFSPMDSDLYGSKGALALLSEEDYRANCEPELRAALDRILPWTRMIRPGPVTVGDRRVDLVKYAIGAQQELIIKPTMLHGGAGIVAGWRSTRQQWRQQLEAALDQPYVLQQRIRPVPELFPTDDEPAEWILTWGAFLTGRGYGGMFVRGSQDTGATVNMGTGASATCCFHELAPN